MVGHLKPGGTNEGNRAVTAAKVQSDQYRSTRAGIEPRIMFTTSILVAQAANKELVIIVKVSTLNER